MTDVVDDIQHSVDSRPKLILLFSDGTGNSSGKLFKTNVWRLYEALDLGPTSDPAERPQVAYYDNGVGTSSFKPMAVLGGVFGFGLKRNVLAIYRYACRNYRPGSDDAIQAFGFSRGAFTIRLVIALIASQGLVEYDDERDLRRKSAAAFREFGRGNELRFLPTRWIFNKLRSAFHAGLDLWDRLHGMAPPAEWNRYNPAIEFVGVWDTVAAYGGPIAELTRAIDNWFYPLSMPNYHLSERVRAARHALAIDDERDSFHPLLWDEVYEARLLAQSAGKAEDDPTKVRPGRLQQVWFTGMHADVGGGYPDESLSFVSLSWIMEGAVAAGIRLLETPCQRIHSMANPYGPMNDSRKGLASYYRYQPRRISAWVNPVDEATYVLRDPAVVDEEAVPRGFFRTRPQKGLLIGCKVHESVIARIASGTDDYAPITLPRTFEVVPPNPPGGNSVPTVSEALRARLRDGILSDLRAETMATLYDKVWLRRILYFSSVGITALLALMPLMGDWVEKLPGIGILQTPRRWLGALIGLVGGFLPGMAKPWIEAWSEHSLVTLLLLLMLLGLWRWTANVELTLRDGTRHMWWRATGVAEGREGPVDSRLRRFRESRPYQRGLQSFKWQILPNILGPLMAVLGLWAIATMLVQLRIAVKDSRADTCVSRPVPTPILFRTDSFCSPTGLHVQAAHRYAMIFTVKEPWSDGDVPATPKGLSRQMVWYANWSASAWQRSVGANWFQPIAAIRPPTAGKHPFATQYLVNLDFVLTRRGYRAEFEAPADGELFLFVNDAVPPPGFGRSNLFYVHDSGPNRGTAEVRMIDLDAPRTDSDRPDESARRWRRGRGDP